jgi:hypothetical protein
MRHTRTTSILGGAGAFAAFYLAASALAFPVAFTKLVAAAKLAMPPTLEYASDKDAHQPGAVLPWPQGLEVPTILGQAQQSAGRGTLITGFDTECSVAASSAAYWRRLTTSLARVGVAHIVIGCGAGAEAIDAFRRSSGYDGQILYGGSCDAVRSSLKLPNSIVHYLVDERNVVLGAWSGKPIYRYAENNVIAQMLHTLRLGTAGGTVSQASPH